ncbi:MAG: branched-chain amino acid ABC transporter permease [Deltaproteobacteria bacterium]|nr:branched-chain amino acid ABC transporter permease [Deltaproteobacteria bacterium]
MDLYLFLSILSAGLCMGGVYAMLAVPFNFQLGQLKVTNFAYGNLLMMAMYVVFVCHDGHVPVWGMFCILLPCYFALGWFLRRYIVFTTDENIQILLTMGLTILIENLVQMVWGSFPRSLGGIEEGMMLGDVYVSLTRFKLLCASMVILGLGYLFLQKSWYGRCIRALVQQPAMAAVMGINTRAVACMAFGASFCYLAFTGYSLMQLYSVEPHTGHSFLSLCFLIAVLGGIGNLIGTVYSAFIIGVISAFISFYVPGYHDPIIFLFFIAMLLFKPSGLFGEA